MTTITQGIVAYTDGSSRQHNGSAGTGVHGYIFRLPSEGERTTKFDAYEPTDMGYFLTKDVPEQARRVVVTDVFNIVYPLPLGSTNNQAEILGIQILFKEIGAYLEKSDYLYLLSDSKYTLNSLGEWYPSRVRSNWKKPDGTEFSNREIITEAYELLQTQKARGFVKLEKVLGHSGELGNTHADYLSNIASNLSEVGELDVLTTISPKGFFKNDVRLHPFLNLKRVYFNTIGGRHTPGVYRQTGWRGNIDYIHGKMQPEVVYSVVKVKDPDPVMENVIARQEEYGSPYQSLVYASTKAINSGDVMPWLVEYGPRALQKHYRNLNLIGMDGQVVTRELSKHELPLRAIEIFTHLEDMLDEYVEEAPNYESDSLWPCRTFLVNDITDLFYETETKVVKGEEKKISKLRKEMVVGIKTIEAPIRFSDGEKSVQSTVTLTFNEDLPDRNNLKKYESMNPKIRLIAWKTSSSMARFATILDCDDGVGVWANYFSNQLVLLDGSVR